MVSQISRHFSVVSKFIRCHFYLRVSKKIVLKRKMSEYFGKRQAGETPASCKRIKVSAADESLTTTTGEVTPKGDTYI